MRLSRVCYVHVQMRPIRQTSLRKLFGLQLHRPTAETDRPKGLEGSRRGALHLHGFGRAEGAAGLQPQTDAEDEERADPAG